MYTLNKPNVCLLPEICVFFCNYAFISNQKMLLYRQTLVQV